MRDLLVGNTYFPWLVILLLAFVFRVFAQLIQWQIGIEFLPKFDDWQGSSMPYPILLIIQTCAIGCFAWITFRVKMDRFSPSVRKYRICLVVGWIYFLSMTFRLIAGQTFAGGLSWFSKPLPAFFHIVIASFIILFGYYLAKLHAVKYEVSSKAF